MRKCSFVFVLTCLGVPSLLAQRGVIRVRARPPDVTRSPLFNASLFQDTDGSVYYVRQDGMIRKLNAAMNGSTARAEAVPTDGQRGLAVVRPWSRSVPGTCVAAEWNGGNRADFGPTI
jgi:hypothetical protein